MPTYATQADFEAYSEGWVTTDPTQLARYLERAETHLDRTVLGYHGTPDAVTGRTFTTALLARMTPVQREALRDATCAQAEYILTMGDDFEIRAQYETVSGPQFSRQGTLDKTGPKVWAALRGSGLANPWGQAAS